MKDLLPAAVLEEIGIQYRRAVSLAAGDFHNQQADEDSVTGALGSIMNITVKGSLVHEGVLYEWHTRNTRVGAKDEKQLGADAVFEIQVRHAGQLVRTKVLPMQAKQRSAWSKKDTRNEAFLVGQVEKMLARAGSALVVDYGNDKYLAANAEHVRAADGDRAKLKSEQLRPLEDVLAAEFLECKIGSIGCRYDSNKNAIVQADGTEEELVARDVITTAIAIHQRASTVGVPAAESLRPGLKSQHHRLHFETPRGAQLYVRSMVSLLAGASNRVTAFGPDTTRSSLSATEIAAEFEQKSVNRVRFEVSIAGAAQHIDLSIADSDPSTVTIEVAVTDKPSTRALWVQCDPDLVSSETSARIPFAEDGFSRETIHAFVDIASRLGGAPEAALVPVIRTWQLDSPWWDRLEDLASRPRESLDELHAHLDSAFAIPFSWTIVDVANAPTGTFVAVPENATNARLVPEPSRVIVAIDLQQPASVIVDALLHLCAHCALGHVRPGDEWGHWDTPESIAAASPRRQWDRDVRAYLDGNVSRPKRRVTSIEECSAREKAWLVLHDHIGRMVGQARTLHPATEHYQAAAYQRQAAQRLVAQLEDYAGAMLCDGVGLGKTYVATTVVVHYANVWADQLAASGLSATDDPFRVTILSPNSVVSTWRREALPPLAAHGVPLATVRVISHSKLSRIVPSSEILERSGGELSDIEHLLWSDLVIVDEAHNFRSVNARRTAVLRDLLRLQTRRDPRLRRKVLLLTATPVNNSLEDLRQQAALLFCKPLWFNDNTTDKAYRQRVEKDLADRLAKIARTKGNGDASALLVHGTADAKFSNAIHFRDDLSFGVQVPRIGDYLKEQEKRLETHQVAVRSAIQTGQALPAGAARIAGELLDRIVVQRSRALCKRIEQEQGSNSRLLFRPDAAAPEKLVYEDIYEDTRDVLAQFLPLFDTEANPGSLSLKVYMWADVREGQRQASEVSSVVGLQRVQVLKRLESSPATFLITLLRLLALHAHRLYALLKLCQEAKDPKRAHALEAELQTLVAETRSVERGRIDLLVTGAASRATGTELLKRWSEAHLESRAAADSDDAPSQLDLFEIDSTAERREQLDRLWELREYLTRDFATLLRTIPGLADIVFGRFEEEDWPHHFVNGGLDIDWPKTSAWGMRIVTDGKLRRLATRLLRGRADAQKIVVFSQFTDTLAYISSVLRAVRSLDRQEWRMVLQLLGADLGRTVRAEEVLALIEGNAVVTGDTEDRDAVINAFAPFYRIGPIRPSLPGMSPAERESVDLQWRASWTQALQQPIDILFATDVLAEGVNLQDAALLINFDVHWNPVRMIQRAGRIDRRLNPAIEEATNFPDLEALARELGVEPPRYWWHRYSEAAPVTANLLLPDELEAELQLRERIANKTLAIDFTLGLEHGTGAEADWMATYRYQGVSALNAWQGDRAIEQIAGYQQRLRRMMADCGIEAEWLSAWNGWLREAGGHPDDRIIAWANLGRKGGEAKEYTRQLQPRVIDGMPHWLWTAEKPVEWSKNFWLVLDSNTHPAATRKDLGFAEDASRPIAAEDLLIASQRIVDGNIVLEELGREVGRPFQQGASAIAAGVFSEEDRRAIQIRGFRILQLRHVDAAPAIVRPSEEAC